MPAPDSATLQRWRQDIQFNATLCDQPLVFRTTWGIFSPEAKNHKEFPPLLLLAQSSRFVVSKASKILTEIAIASSRPELTFCRILEKKKNLYQTHVK